MLNIFPDLLTYGLVSATLLRVIVGFVLIRFGFSTLLKNKRLAMEKLVENKYPSPGLMVWVLGILKIITGAFLIMGLLTQGAALVAAYIFVNLLIIDDTDDRIFGQTPLFYLVMIVISISLLFSGAGFFAIDLPL